MIWRASWIRPLFIHGKNRESRSPGVPSEQPCHLADCDNRHDESGFAEGVYGSRMTSSSTTSEVEPRVDEHTASG